MVMTLTPYIKSNAAMAACASIQMEVIGGRMPDSAPQHLRFNKAIRVRDQGRTLIIVNGGLLEIDMRDLVMKFKARSGEMRILRLQYAAGDPRERIPMRFDSCDDPVFWLELIDSVSQL